MSDGAVQRATDGSWNKKRREMLSMDVHEEEAATATKFPNSPRRINRGPLFSAAASPRILGEFRSRLAVLRLAPQIFRDELQ